MKGPTERILGFDVTRLSGQDCIEQIIRWIQGGERQKYFACLNPHSVQIALNDEEFNDALGNADILVPDGAGIVLASRALGGKLKSTVTGSDVFEGVTRRLNALGRYRCFFLGSTEKTLELITQRMKSDYPSIEVAGTYSPPFKDVLSPGETGEMVTAVNRAAPDVLWVGMTAPKQEKWVHRNRHRLDVAFIGPIGAVFDFYAGNVTRSHPMFRQLGLEWLPRLLRQPRRLWRRNFVSTPMFVLRVLKEKFKGSG